LPWPRIIGVKSARTPPASGVGFFFTSYAGFFFTSYGVFSIALGVRFLRHQTILSIDNLTFPIYSEAFGERFSAPTLRFARVDIDRFAR
jgi:hypothetical protein